MKIREIVTENIFTCDYHKVMDAVAHLYQTHYDINIWERADAHDEAAKVLMKQRDLCTSGKPDSALGASQLASCKSQGYRSRDGGKSHKVGSERIAMRGKKIKGKKYGGPLPDWS